MDEHHRGQQSNPYLQEQSAARKKRIPDGLILQPPTVSVSRSYRALLLQIDISRYRLFRRRLKSDLHYVPGRTLEAYDLKSAYLPNEDRFSSLVDRLKSDG